MANISFNSYMLYVKPDTMCLKNSHVARSLYATPAREATSPVMEMTNVEKYVGQLPVSPAKMESSVICKLKCWKRR